MSVYSHLYVDHMCEYKLKCVGRGIRGEINQTFRFCACKQMGQYLIMIFMWKKRVPSETKSYDILDETF